MITSIRFIIASKSGQFCSGTGLKGFNLYKYFEHTLWAYLPVENRRNIKNTFTDCKFYYQDTEKSNSIPNTTRGRSSVNHTFIGAMFKPIGISFSKCFFLEK